MKRLLGMAMVLTLGMASPAFADHGGYRDNDGRECRGGGCDNDRRENYEGAGCKYVCPTFDKSPVQDSFNVCLPGATCYWGDRRNDRQDEEGQRPS